MWMKTLAMSENGDSAPGRSSVKWYRGQLHAHSYWSDGRHFPEYGVAEYRDRGYHFLCVSDHNRFATDPNDWREVHAEEGKWPPNITQAAVDDCKKRFGSSAVDIRIRSGKEEARLKTFSEVKACFEVPGRFLLLPGVEITQTVGQSAVHVNVINIPCLPASVAGAPYVKKVGDGLTPGEVIGMNYQEASLSAARHAVPWLFIVDHPLSFYCDLVPEDIIHCQEVEFIEICNNGSKFPPPAGLGRYDLELFWDAVNAFRLHSGLPLVYGIGSDDAHYYDSDRIGLVNGVGDAWIDVRASELKSEDVFRAMRRGDFYASCGVELEDVDFDAETKKMRVWVKPQDGVDYTIHFITTKRDFNRSVGSYESPAFEGRPQRSIPVYSDDIGRIGKTVAGSYGEYVMAADDLYVRARIESSVPSSNRCLFHPTVKCAWTQPQS